MTGPTQDNAGAAAASLGAADAAYVPDTSGEWRTLANAFGGLPLIDYRGVAGDREARPHAITADEMSPADHVAYELAVRLAGGETLEQAQSTLAAFTVLTTVPGKAIEDLTDDDRAYLEKTNAANKALGDAALLVLKTGAWEGTPPAAEASHGGATGTNTAQEPAQITAATDTTPDAPSTAQSDGAAIDSGEPVGASAGAATISQTTYKPVTDTRPHASVSYEALEWLHGLLDHLEKEGAQLWADTVAEGRRLFHRPTKGTT